MGTFKERIRKDVFAPVRFFTPFPHRLLGVCGSAHVYLHSASVVSTVKKVPHIFIPPVLTQSSTRTFGGFPRLRFMKAGVGWVGVSFMSLNTSYLILSHINNNFRYSSWSVI